MQLELVVYLFSIYSVIFKGSGLKFTSWVGEVIKIPLRKLFFNNRPPRGPTPRPCLSPPLGLLIGDEDPTVTPNGVKHPPSFSISLFFFLFSFFPLVSSFPPLLLLSLSLFMPPILFFSSLPLPLWPRLACFSDSPDFHYQTLFSSRILLVHISPWYVIEHLTEVKEWKNPKGEGVALPLGPLPFVLNFQLLFLGWVF